MYRSLRIVLVLVAVSKCTSIAYGFGYENFSVKPCQEASGISDDVLNSLLIKKFEPQIIDLKAQCFVGCLLKQIGILKSNGSINTELFFNNLMQGVENVDEVTEKLKKCDVQSGQSCEKEYESAVCIERVTEFIRYRKSR